MRAVVKITDCRMRVVAMQHFTDSTGDSAILIRTSDVVGADRKQRDRNVVVNGEHVILHACMNIVSLFSLQVPVWM